MHHSLEPAVFIGGGATGAGLAGDLALRGFAGFEVHGNRVRYKPELPKVWTSLRADFKSLPLPPVR
jgi:trehalose/maltose hydrolase-like predicted phosphorylase